MTQGVALRDAYQILARLRSIFQTKEEIMKKDRRYMYCAFDICDTQLKEFCYVCDDNGKYYCSEECALRDVQEHTPKETVTWQ